MQKNKDLFIVDGGRIVPITIPDGLLADKVPPAVYTVKASQAGYYLQHNKNSFEQPDKLYGTTKARAKRVEKVYEDTTESTGVLFTGLKGAGKSLLMKEIANNMIKKDLPVVIIQDNFRGSEFMAFMEKIGECVVLLDEFGKIYKTSNSDDENEQHSLLTFFDGVYSSKRLVLLAENKTWDVDDLFMDRPSRILFHWKYNRLEEEVVVGYCKDNLIEKSFKEDILKVYKVSKDFTFDSLKAVVSQCNMFKKLNFNEIIDGLNIPMKEDVEKEIVSFVVDGKEAMDKIVKFKQEGSHALRITYQFQKKTKDSNGFRAFYIDDNQFLSKVGTLTTYKSKENEKEIIIVVNEKKPTYAYKSF